MRGGANNDLGTQNKRVRRENVRFHWKSQLVVLAKQKLKRRKMNKNRTKRKFTCILTPTYFFSFVLFCPVLFWSSFFLFLMLNSFVPTVETHKVARIKVEDDVSPRETMSINNLIN